MPYWKRALDLNFNLTRQVLPGRTDYTPWAYSEQELQYINRHPELINQVGYHPEERFLEFAAYLQPDQRLNLRDFYQLAYLKAVGLPTGEPLDKIIVTFASKDMAERDFMQLSEMGIVVQYPAEDGSWLEMRAA